MVKEVVLVRQRQCQRLGTHAPVAAAPGPAGLPHLPEEIWLAALEFLRSADFVTTHALLFLYWKQTNKFIYSSSARDLALSKHGGSFLACADSAP